MKLLKTNIKTNDKTITEQYQVGNTVKWCTRFFDGRVTELIKHTGTVVKVNRKTIDVETLQGDVYRLEAWVNIYTGEWELE